MKFLNSLKSVLILYFCFALCACGKKTETGQPPVEVPTPSTSAPTPVDVRKSSSFQLETLALPEPNQYAVVIKTYVSSQDLFISRKTGEESPKLIGNFFKNQSTFEDRDVVSGKRYEYTFFSNDSGKMDKKETLSIEIPRDLVLTGTQTKPKTEGFQRLFLLEGSRIVTNGETMEIEVAELISRNGIIETYPEGVKPSPLVQGRSGGFISIKAKQAKGTLVVLNRGENGGDGITGSRGENGRQGAKGDPIYYHRRQEDPRCLFIDLNPRTVSCFICEKAPTSGHPGYQGSAGGPGSPGAKGGDTALIQVLVEKASSFQVDIRNLPGKGGNGGMGGEGGNGGAGGESGTQAQAEVCPTPPPASSGPKGATGANGARGSDGLTSPICLNIAGQESPDCLRFKK